MDATPAAQVAQVPAVPTDSTGYLLLAAEVDGRGGKPSQTKSELLATLKDLAPQLRRDLFANVLIFTAGHIAGTAAARSGTGGPTPRYDVGVLIQAPTVESAQWLGADPAFLALHDLVRRAARTTHVTVTYNTRGDVCEYGPRLPRVYVLMRYADQDRREVVPGWGWTSRRHLVTDLLFSRSLWRYLLAGSGPATVALYRLA